MKIFRFTQALMLTLLMAFAPLVPAQQHSGRRAAAKPAATEDSKPEAPAQPSGKKVSSLRVVVLSTMLADDGIGEWGYAAYVEADGHRLLFDTGARSDTVLQNAKELNIDLADVQDVLLSHNHDDHVGGLITLRKAFRKQNPKALSRAHVGRGIFWSRPGKNGGENNTMIPIKNQYELLGGKFLEHPEAVELFPGVWVTGSVPRIHPERNWSGSGRVETPDGVVEDNIPEDLSLVVDTDQGLVVISGCGHAGIINTLECARKKVREAPVLAVIGGFHLFDNDDESLDWTAKKLKEFGVKNVLGGHCTGIEAVYHIRNIAGLDRKTCVVSSVGSSFSLDKGLDPRDLAK